ncbi:MAG: hypothetical protein BWY68_00324 [bacterium ADurb.Bin400]|nr:MAG: hypothetical protein BWY68_00324 [bacterium ADurb.Bin400]
MSYQDKITRALVVIEEHYAEVCQDFDSDSFLNKLRKDGGTSEETLRQFTWEDLQSYGLPKVLARRVAEMFRETDTTKQRPAFVSANKAERMTPAELVAAYDPRDPSNAVGTRLSGMVNNQPCIVFTDNGQVDAENSLTLVNELRDGFPPRDILLVSGHPRKVYRIGERPTSWRMKIRSTPARFFGRTAPATRQG